MQYNTQRTQMRMPEYGRTVHEMIQHAVGLEDREERQLCAETIVALMIAMHPSEEDALEVKTRVWDHLAYIADYKLDVDYPVEITRLGEQGAKPQVMHYPMTKIRHRQYGHMLESALQKLQELPEGEERDAMLALIANQMKQHLFIWNRDAMDDEKVAGDIAEYTQGKVTLDLEHFTFGPVQTLPRQDGSKKKKKK